MNESAGRELPPSNTEIVRIHITPVVNYELWAQSEILSHSVELISDSGCSRILLMNIAMENVRYD